MGVAGCGRRHVAWRAVGLIVAILGASLMLSAPALAISQRGHSFSFAFGSIADPSGVGVSAQSGDVYVSDLSHKRVQQFRSVIENGQIVGEPYVREIKVSAPGAIAVDNSTEGTDPSRGDVYVVSGGHVVEKFGPEGESLGAIKAFEIKGKGKKLAGILGIAVDASGHLFVSEGGGVIYEFSDAASNESESELSAAQAFPIEQTTERPGLAVDSGDDLYLDLSEDTLPATGQGELLREIGAEFGAYRAAAEEPAVPFTVAAKLDSAANKLLVPALDDEYASAIAVNPRDVATNSVDERDDAYVVNVTGYGTGKASTVAQFAPEAGEHEGGHLIQRFGAPNLVEGDAVAVNPESGAVYVADEASGNVDLFQLETPSRPTVEGVTAESSTTLSDSETLSANVDPDGASTSYYFEYGSVGCLASSSCARTSPTEIEGFGDQPASVPLASLAPGTYSYRIVAENTHGRVEGGEQTFTILSSLGVLPDGRGWELVSPPNKAGAEPEAIRREGGLIEASPEGNAITYAADGPMPAEASPEGNRNPEPTQVLSVRGGEGWSSQDITTANSTGAGPAPGERWEYQLFSSDLALSLVDPFPGVHGYGRLAQPPLSPPIIPAEAGKQENTLYLRDDAPLSPAAAEEQNYEQAKENGVTMGNPGYLALVTELNGPGAGFGRSLKVEASGVVAEAATPDLSHVVYRSEAVKPGLYEWSKGHSELISVLENGIISRGQPVTQPSTSGLRSRAKNPPTSGMRSRKTARACSGTYYEAATEATHLEAPRPANRRNHRRSSSTRWKKVSPTRSHAQRGLPDRERRRI